MKKSKEWKKVEDSVLVDWDKQKTKPIEGKITSIVIAKSKKGEKKEYKIFKIETSAGVIAFTGSQLEQKLQNVKVGGEVKIVYKGKAKTAGGFKVNTFDVWLR